MSWSRAPLPDNLTAQVDWPDLMLHACTVLGEAEGEPWEGKLAVAWSIVNRAEDPKERWPQTVGKVCLQPQQFSCWRDNKRLAAMRSPRMYTSPGVWEMCFKAACAAMYKLAADPTGGCNHYAVIGTNPYWAKGMEPLAVLGDHEFWRL